jgi:tRNA threonylcarbamoyladenosine biosynthesis protein TsaE
MTMEGFSGSVISCSPEQTQQLGVELARRLEPGEVLAFFGDLGAGKTCLIQGICRGLGVEDYVNSPTFVLINEYQGYLAAAAIPVYHFDLYRLGTEHELEDLGVDEYLYGQGICLIEWAEHAGGLLPAQRREVALEHLDPDRRRITVRDIKPVS